MNYFVVKDSYFYKRIEKTYIMTVVWKKYFTLNLKNIMQLWKKCNEIFIIDAHNLQI